MSRDRSEQPLPAGNDPERPRLFRRRDCGRLPAARAARRTGARRVSGRVEERRDAQTEVSLSSRDAARGTVVPLEVPLRGTCTVVEGAANVDGALRRVLGTGESLMHHPCASSVPPAFQTAPVSASVSGRRTLSAVRARSPPVATSDRQRPEPHPEPVPFQVDFVGVSSLSGAPSRRSSARPRWRLAWAPRADCLARAGGRWPASPPS